MKELSLWETEEEDLADVSPQIKALAGGCKFRNCSHVHEPRCAVPAAAKRGEINGERYRNYVRLQKGR